MCPELNSAAFERHNLLTGERRKVGSCFLNEGGAWTQRPPFLGNTDLSTDGFPETRVRPGCGLDNGPSMPEALGLTQP